MSFPPNLFLVGAQKAGTTYLANLLDQHPEICVSRPKEPAYFTRNLTRGQDWYRARFENTDARFLLDATTGYSSSPLPDLDEDPEDNPFWGVASRIGETSPDARILYIVREPAARTYSAYWHSVRAGHEGRPFQQAISEETYYLRTSRYFDQLEFYREQFGREAILVMRFEDLVTDPVRVLADCFEFLELPPVADVDTLQGKNRSFAYSGILGSANRWLAGIGGLNSLAKSMRPMIPGRLEAWLYEKIARPIPPMHESDRRSLEAYFRPHNKNLLRHYGIEVSGV